MVKCALTPGTFDPITVGHLDVITRASQLVDEVIVAVAESVKKKPLFTLEERVALAEEATRDLDNVRVVSFDGLLVDFAHEVGATAVVKGLRAITDFGNEFQMTAINYQLDRNLETLSCRPRSICTSLRRWCGKSPLWAATSRSSCRPVSSGRFERSSGTNRVESLFWVVLFAGCFRPGDFRV